MLKQGLVEDEDFVIVTKKAIDSFISWYGESNEYAPVPLAALPSPVFSEDWNDCSADFNYIEPAEELPDADKTNLIRLSNGNIIEKRPDDFIRRIFFIQFLFSKTPLK